MPSTKTNAPAGGKSAAGSRGSGAKAARLAGTARPALKNPLRTTAMGMTAPGSFPASDAGPGLVPRVSAPQLRKMAISEFSGWLRTQTNKNKLPSQERAVEAYAETARVLDRWMTEQGIDGDFAACDTAVLNRFFLDYRNSHTQGGTNTRQRNLHHLFKWLAKAYGHPDPWTDDLVRYGPAEVPPSTLAREVIQDLLELTGNGRPARFEDVRDHAIIRMLTEGVRREELAQMETGDLPENLIASPFVRVVPLKGARASSQGRLVSLSLATARALAAYLRVRRSHRYADLPVLWLGSRDRGPMTASGVYQMLHRRALQAGYEPIVRPHQFRHTFTNDWLDGGGSEGDLMRLMGWKNRSMVDRYAKDMQVARAVKAKRARGDMY
jgi:integrase/recombinase XerD